MEEHLENCLTKISQIETQQQEQQVLEGYLDVDAKLILSKCLGFLINVSFVLIFLINSLRKMMVPLVKNRFRAVVSGVTFVCLFVLWRRFGGFGCLYHLLVDVLISAGGDGS